MFITIFKGCAGCLLTAIGFIIFCFVAVAVLDKMGVLPESDYCIEDGDCEEGREMTLPEGGSFIVNEENCLKYEWIWYEKHKMCKIDWMQYMSDRKKGKKYAGEN